MLNAVRKAWFMSKAFHALEIRHGIKFGPFDPGYSGLAEVIEQGRQKGMTPEQAAAYLMERSFGDNQEYADA